jgi:hypothetical protein
VLQLKISLRSAKPPIWRRVEVTGDTTLEVLHHIIQRTFAWNGDHPHTFSTSYGDFAANMFGDDEDFGRQDAASATVEQVLSSVKSKISYLYDFGDDWDHQIVVEKMLERDETVAYPRCTDGRLAAPPDDCGGIWGYQNMVDALAGAAHPDHEHYLDWLGIDSPSQFDAERFDIAAVNQQLANLR